MFTIEKLRVKNDEDIVFNHNVLENLKIIAKDDDFPHIIIYGPPGSGKKTMVERFLYHLFNGKASKTEEHTYYVTSSSNKTHEELITQSNHHIEIEPKGNNFDRHLIQDIVKKYSMTSALSLNIQGRTQSLKLVLIKNLEKLSEGVQFSLRRTLEMYSSKCRFLFITNSLSKIIEPLRSRCKRISVPSPNLNSRIDFALNIIYHENIDIDIKKLLEIDKYSDRNIKTLLWYFQIYISNIDMLKYIKNIIEKKYPKLINFYNILDNYYKTEWFDTSKRNEMIKLFNDELYKEYGYKNEDIQKTTKSPLFQMNNLLTDLTDSNNYHQALVIIISKLMERNIKNIHELRNSIFSLMITNIEHNKITRDLLDLFLERNDISIEAKFKLGEIFGKHEHSLVKSRRSIIHFDSLFFSIMDVLNKYN